MAYILATAHALITPLHDPLHRYLPFAPLDIFGAIRLSQVIYWVSTGALSPQESSPKTKQSPKKGVVKDASAIRPDALQECIGLMVVLFGGETFLATCTRTPPSWLLSPKIGLLFGITHLIQTRTSLRYLIPAKPALGLELLLSVPDALGRTLLLTRFTTLPLLRQSPQFFPLPATPTSLILVPLILASPFAALAFTGANLFSPTPSLATPMELAPRGWLMVDAWLPLVLPAVFCSLIGPTPGWEVGLGWNEDEAVVGCFAFVLAAFVGRTVYNLGYRRDQWDEMLGLNVSGRKSRKVD